MTVLPDVREIEIAFSDGLNLHSTKMGLFWERRKLILKKRPLSLFHSLSPKQHHQK
jgi:hypothetical protein